MIKIKKYISLGLFVVLAVGTSFFVFVRTSSADDFVSNDACPDNEGHSWLTKPQSYAYTYRRTDSSGTAQEFLCCCDYLPGTVYGPTGEVVNSSCESTPGCKFYTVQRTQGGSEGYIPPPIKIDPGSTTVQLENSPFSGVDTLISQWFAAGFYIGVVLAVIMVFYGGFTYAIAAGDAKKTGEAKEIIMDAVIGLGIVLLSGAILVFLRGPGVFVFQ